MAASRMLEVDLPCGGSYRIKNLVLDLNGTLTVDGILIEGVEERLKALCATLSVSILTADTNLTLEGLVQSLGPTCALRVHRLASGRGDLQKLAFLQEIGRESTIAIGNGCSDALMLKDAALGICIMGKEGAALEAIRASKLVFLHICDALDLILKRNRLIATLRR